MSTRFVAVLLSLAGLVCMAQRGVPPPGRPEERPRGIQINEGAVPANARFTGSTPSGDAEPRAIPLTIHDAVARGLRYNLGVIGGDVGSRRAAAQRIAQLSTLLPNVTGRIVESSQQVNLKAFGFGGLPGVPTIVGPFEVFDLRAALSQAILDLSALSGWRASKEAARSAELASRDIRDSVVLLVVNLYLQATTGSARIQAAEAQVATAEAEYKQAVNMRTAGTVAGIEVLRAQVQLRVEEQRLISLRNDYEREKLDLARAIGLPPGQQFTLASEITFTDQPVLSLNEGLQQSLQTRADYQAAIAAERSAELQRRSAVAERWPALYFNGDYGTIGPSIHENHVTYTAAIGLQVPIFEGGRIRAAVQQAEANLTERRADTANLRGRIDYDVRTAFLNFNAAREQVRVAEDARKLSQQQLVQARDRFAAGVANNLEVVQAQQFVALANENLIESLYLYNLSRAAIGRAVGRAQEIPSAFLGITTK